MGRDYRQELTDKIIGALEAGTAPWQKPWSGIEPMMPYNPVSGTVYRGGNVIALMMQEYADPRWCTYKQAEAQGWQVRKGARSTLIEFWKFHGEEEREDAETGEKTKVRVALERPIVRFANVFNVAQMDNVPALTAGERTFGWEPLEMAERILSQSGVPVFHDQLDRAFYTVARDEIHLPPQETFGDAMRYYGTALHELGHATGHPTRLDRKLGNAFGSEDYAKEELRAEMASLFLANRLGVPFDVGQHAAYVGSWIRVLKEDKNELFRAAREAEQITEYVIGLGREQERVQGRESDRETGRTESVEACEAGAGAAQPTVGAVGKPLPTSEMGDGRPAPRRRINLNVPFPEKEEAKGLGAKWDKNQKTWYVPANVDPSAFQKWLEAPHALTRDSIQRQFADALRDAGLVTDGVPEMDGTWHRTTVTTSKNTRALKGAYIGHLDDEMPNGYIRNFDTGHSAPWFPEGLILSNEQRRQFEQQAAENRRLRDQDLAAEREKVAARCAAKWAALENAESHPYLERKQVEAFGVKIQGDRLVQPVRDADGKIWSLQYIPADPGQIKLYEKGGQKTGNFHVLGDLASGDVVLFGEGYATCGSLHMGSLLPVVEVFDSSNIEPVLAALKPHLKGKTLLICGDDDVLTTERVLKTLNKIVSAEHTQEKLEVAEVRADEIIIDGQRRPLAANPECFMRLEYKTGPEGVQRVVGEFDNEATGQHVAVLVNNVGREKALAAAAAHEIEAVFPTFRSLDDGPSDFNDLHVREGLNAVREQLAPAIARAREAERTFKGNAGLADDACDGLRTFADVKAMLDKVPSHKALCALTDAVDERFMRDQRQLTMTDADWEEWTVLVARKAAQFEPQAGALTPEQVAKRALGEAAVVVPPKDSGRYVGPVLANTERHAVQDVGRRTAVAHELEKLDRTPVAGQSARITYQSGRGVVQETRHQQTRGNRR